MLYAAKKQTGETITDDEIFQGQLKEISSHRILYLKQGYVLLLPIPLSTIILTLFWCITRILHLLSLCSDFADSATTANYLWKLHKFSYYILFEGFSMVRCRDIKIQSTHSVTLCKNVLGNLSCHVPLNSVTMNALAISSFFHLFIGERTRGWQGATN